MSSSCTTGALLVALLGASTIATGQALPGRNIVAGTAIDNALGPDMVHTFTLALRKGESASVVVTQIGVDIIVDLVGPDGVLIDSFDSPNGRNGDEVVEVFATAPGTYSLRVHAFDASEPVGKYHLAVSLVRDEAETRSLLHARKAARDSASAWLRPMTSGIPSNGEVAVTGSYPALDRLASRVRVLGIGEATHGSREFNDFRVSATRRLIERFGYRVVAIEGSAYQLSRLNDIASGHGDSGSVASIARETGWIGERARIALASVVTDWNRKHPADRVSIVGVDPQIAPPQQWFAAFLVRAYGADVGSRWLPMAQEIASADSQVLVFGNSDVNARTLHALFEVLARLDLDAPVLDVRLGRASVDSARVYVRQFTEFADFNGGGDSSLVVASHNRDWYMANRVLSALESARPNAKVVYWAHDGHISAPRAPGASRAGTILRSVLGCGYGALGESFGEGGFVSQMPNDLEDRLHVAILPAAPSESVDAMLSAIQPGALAVTWSCTVTEGIEPQWLKVAHPMHIVGGLFAPGSLPSSAFRPYDILRDFDGLVYFPHVTAEALPPRRAVVPARVR